MVWLAAVASSCSVDDRSTVVASAQPVAVDGAAGDEEQDEVTPVSLAETESEARGELAGDLPLAPSLLSLGQRCTPESAPCEAALRCVDGRCRVPCVTSDDCAMLGADVSCVVGAALDGSGVGACTYAAYCDPAHPALPIAGADRCPEGSGCRASSTGASECQLQPGGVTLGGACVSDVNCAPGYFCADYGTCRRYCLDDADCNGQSCSAFVPARRAGELAVGFCAPLGCDSVHPQTPIDGASACPSASSCSPTDNPDEPGVCVDRSSATSRRLDECVASSDCLPGLYCGGDARLCHAYCFSDDDCGGGRCAPFVTPGFAAGKSVGFCTAVCNPVAPSSSEGGFGVCPVGLGCSTRFDGASFCRQAGSKGPYQPCESSRECAPGVYCDGGLCRAYCLADSDCPVGRCSLLESGFAGDVQVGTCAQMCNPVAPGSTDGTFNACPDGLGCVGSADGVSRCRRAGAGLAGDACDANVDCAPGLGCGSSSQRCRRLCFEAADCDSGECTPFPTATFAGSRVLGFCADS